MLKDLDYREAYENNRYRNEIQAKKKAWERKQRQQKQPQEGNMFNYLIEDRIGTRDLPVPLDEYSENNRERYLFTLVDGDTVLTLSIIFAEYDVRRLKLVGKEVITRKERLDFFAYS